MCLRNFNGARQGATLVKAILLAATAAILVAAAWAIMREPQFEVDRTAYEGKGGQAALPAGLIEVPDIAAEAASTTSPAEVLKGLDQPRSWLERLLGNAGTTAELGGRVCLLWPSAVTLAHREPQQWPVAHVCAMIDPTSKRITYIALIGSLGRVLEHRPGEADSQTTGTTP